jgi:putative ubiquitin-RnfH superfamily antitoxin RatB of RatAB toxin-antitoxin module
MSESGSIRVVLVFSPGPRKTVQLEVLLPAGSTLHALLHSAELSDRLAGLGMDLSGQSPSIWGHKCTAQTVLNDQDRVEFCRALRVDPKVARRERFQKQGARTTGLFARQRPGAKSGY